MSINTGNDYIYKYPFYNVKNTILDNLYNSDIINEYSLEKYNNINNNYKGFLLKLLDIYKIFFNSLDINIDINKNLNLFNKIIINNIIKEQKNIKEENRLKNKRSYSQISEIKKKSSDIKKKQFKKIYIKPSTTNIRRKKIRINFKGGNISYNYSNIVKYYLKNQYIFDNKHDFHNLITNNEYKYNENDIKTDDNETITINELKDLYKKDERDIFYNIISKDIDIINNLYYFSIFDSIDIDKTKFYGKSIFEKLDLTDEEVISNLKKDFKLYIEDILNKANYIHDVNLTSGSIDKNLTSSLTKLGLSVDLYNELNNYKEDYVKFVKLLNEYLNDKRIITIVDTYDSASINTTEAQEKLNNYIITDIANNIAFISNNIYEKNNLTAIPDELKDIFKCFNNDTIELFTLGYYIEDNGFKTAFIFKKKEIIDIIIENLTQKNITYNFKKLKKNNNIYEINNNNFDYYAFDLLDNNTRNFNSKNRISNIINNFIDNFKNDNNNIFGFIDNNKILEKNIDYYIISYLYLYLSNSDFNKKGKEINNNIHKKIAKILFDLKKGGDVAKLLFVFYYNYFDEKSDTNIVNIKNKLIPDVLNFSSNDKLAALASIVRKSNSVLFSDPSIFSIFMYKNNKDKNIDIKKIFSWFKLYFGDILTSKNLNIFNKINNLNGNENIKLLNNIIKIINENNIQLYIKKDNINTFSNINIELENIKNNNSDKQDLIQSIKIYLNIFTSQYISQENINNNYIKEILFIYIDDIIENIKNNFKNEIVINYFTEKILFNSIQDLNDTKKYNIIFKELVKTLLNNIYNIIYKLFDIIKDKIKNTDLDLTDSDNLYDLLTKINSIIKIIEIFLFYTEKNIENKKRKKEENKKETINNIFDFFEDLENYIKNIIFYKYINDIGLIRELNPEKTKTLNLYNVSDFLRVELKQGIFDIKIRDKAIKQEYEIRRNIDSIFNRLLSGINIINYIVIFQKFYMYFDILLNNFKILEDIDISFKKYLNELIYYIKKIYYYSYLQIYTLGFELNTEQYINFIFANIRDAITIASNDKFQFNSKKNELDPSIIEENIIKGDEMIKIIEEKISIFKEKVSTFHNNILIENTKNEDIIILITDINPEINIPKKIKEPTEKLKINLDNIFKNINENTITRDILSNFNKIDDDEGKLIKIEISNENIIIKKIFNIYNFFINNKEINESIIENIYEPSSKMDISHGGGLFNIISLENPLNFKDILKIFN